jgi:hypothetical protein
VITHDVSTMTAAAYRRLRESDPMPGLIVVPQQYSVGTAVRRLENLLTGQASSGLYGKVTYL